MQEFKLRNSLHTLLVETPNDLNCELPIVDEGWECSWLVFMIVAHCHRKTISTMHSGKHFPHYKLEILPLLLKSEATINRRLLWLPDAF